VVWTGCLSCFLVGGVLDEDFGLLSNLFCLALGHFVGGTNSFLDGCGRLLSNGYFFANRLEDLRLLRNVPVHDLFWDHRLLLALLNSAPIPCLTQLLVLGLLVRTLLLVDVDL
jgi:hypothetical protein